MIIDNIPSHTGVNIAAETTLQLAEEVENIIGIKESSNDLCQSMKIIKSKPKNFFFISGDDYMVLPNMALGADGAISTITNAYPSEYSQIVHSCLYGDFRKAGKIYFQLHDILNVINEDGHPAGLKALLEILELSQNNIRLPHVKVQWIKSN